MLHNELHFNQLCFENETHLYLYKQKSQSLALVMSVEPLSLMRTMRSLTVQFGFLS